MLQICFNEKIVLLPLRDGKPGSIAGSLGWLRACRKTLSPRTYGYLSFACSTA